MSTTTSYKIRRGNVLPILGAGSGGPNTPVIVWTFGIETQVITSCESTSDIKSSKDMCLLGGGIFSAQYKAQPGKADCAIKFNSTIMENPILSPDYSNYSTNNGQLTNLCDF